MKKYHFLKLLVAFLSVCLSIYSYAQPIIDQSVYPIKGFSKQIVKFENDFVLNDDYTKTGANQV